MKVGDYATYKQGPHDVFPVWKVMEEMTVFGEPWVGYGRKGEFLSEFAMPQRLLSVVEPVLCPVSGDIIGWMKVAMPLNKDERNKL